MFLSPTIVMPQLMLRCTSPRRDVRVELAFSAPSTIATSRAGSLWGRAMRLYEPWMFVDALIVMFVDGSQSSSSSSGSDERSGCAVYAGGGSRVGIVVG